MQSKMIKTISTSSLLLATLIVAVALESAYSQQGEPVEHGTIHACKKNEQCHDKTS